MKRTAPTEGTCTFVQTGDQYSYEIDSLTANTEYTYKVYDDDGCTQEIASATFTTPYSLIASSVTSTSATLTLAGHTGNWWYQANAAPDNSCKDAGSGTTQALSGLTSNTSYTYTAYSNSSCSTALASAAVSTYDVTVGNLDKPVYLESCRVSSHTHCAVGFTTGDGTYTLAAITARFKSKTHPQGRYLGDIVVTLHESASNTVGDMKRPAAAECATLVGSNPDAAGDYTYTCTAGGGNDCSLAANTTYFIEFAATGGGTFEGYNWATTESYDENLNPAGNGWSLTNGTDSTWTAGPGWPNTPTPASSWYRPRPTARRGGSRTAGVRPPSHSSPVPV